MLMQIGCVNLNSNIKLTEFPKSPKYTPLTSKPVVDYNGKTKQYTVTNDAMTTFINNQIYLDEILYWRRENNIR